MSTVRLKRARELREKQQQEERMEIMEKVVEKIEEPIAEKEVKEDVFVCPHCSREYKTKRGLDKHIETKHNKDGE